MWASSSLENDCWMLWKRNTHEGVNRKPMSIGGHTLKKNY
jgi:hypothetical protein